MAAKFLESAQCKNDAIPFSIVWCSNSSKKRLFDKIVEDDDGMCNYESPSKNTITVEEDELNFTSSLHTPKKSSDDQSSNVSSDLKN